ncbi:MAG: GntR family transcriptional regulator [Nitrospinota bacterium]|jgi:GntR family transcriptional regulator|nr:GntR family transcriptional regulator [Nitrospinota bacterium]
MNEISAERTLKDKSIPYYYQIMNVLRRKIEQGELAPGEKLPKELDLAKSFGVSRVTLRQALSILEADGLLERARGHGTFVKKTLRNPKKIKLTGIIEQNFSTGEERRLLSIDEVTAAPDVEEFFDLPDNSRLTRIRRLKMSGDSPYCYTMNFLPSILANKVERNDILNQSMFDIIKKRLRIHIGKINQAFEARTADNEVAEHLKIGLLDPVLYVETFVYGTDGEPIEFSQIYYQGSQHKYSIELLSNGDIL